MRSWLISVAVLGTVVASAPAHGGTQHSPKAWLGFGYTLHNFGPQAPVQQWLYVVKVAEKGPANAAGLRVQDVIVAINGKKVKFATAAAALAYFASTKPGAQLRFDVIRQEKRIVVTVRARAIPEDYAAQWSRNEALAKQSDAKTDAKRKPDPQ